ncbi:MAG: type II toxin-antitoxin system HicA family toxin [Burkholderiales bacterium]
MPRELPKITAKEIMALLEKEGFVCVRQSGSHKIYKNSQGKRTTVPFHGSKILHPKLLKSILRDADVSVERLHELL